MERIWVKWTYRGTVIFFVFLALVQLPATFIATSLFIGLFKSGPTAICGVWQTIAENYRRHGADIPE
jgi:hypothetical protein